MVLSVSVSQSMWIHPVQRQGNIILNYPCSYSYGVSLRSAGVKLNDLKQELIISC